MSSIHSKGVAAGLACFAIAGLLALPSRADDPEKSGPKLKGLRQVIDPDRDCEIAFRDRAVSMVVPGTAHDFSAELGKQNAPRVLSEVRGDFVADVKVSGEFKPGVVGTTPGRRPFHGGGLLVIKDKDNYISLYRSCIFLNGKLRHYAGFELRKDGRMVISHSEIEIPDQDAYLRLERRGDRVFDSISSDGVHWTSYNPIALEMPEAVQFGLVGINTSEVPLSIKFQDLAVFRRAQAE